MSEPMHIGCQHGPNVNHMPGALLEIRKEDVKFTVQNNLLTGGGSGQRLMAVA